MLILAAPTAAVQDKSGWMTCAAVVMKHHFSAVLTVAWEFTTAIIFKMYQLPVSVSMVRSSWTTSTIHSANRITCEVPPIEKSKIRRNCQ